MNHSCICSIENRNFILKVSEFKQTYSKNSRIFFAETCSAEISIWTEFREDISRYNLTLMQNWNPKMQKFIIILILPIFSQLKHNETGLSEINQVACNLSPHYE
mgnify:CR=1 FL=1